MKVGIIGYGHVGQAMHQLFKNAVIFDLHKNIGSMVDINLCDTAFICVPTPMNADGSCHTDIVENVIKWCECPLLIIRSTVPVGFTNKMVEKYQKYIVFQPEYYGETVSHPFANLSERQWLAFGGTKQAIHLAIKTYQQVINSNVRIYQAQSNEVEMAKYMENVYLATKVTFCNEFYRLCQNMGVDYHQVREIWTADPRIGTSHTFVYEDNLGYGGSCLPKDIASIKNQAECIGCDMTLIDAVIETNARLKKL
ncbi:MAG: hypothetical protein ACTTG7_04715 [Aggregatibacter segnis]|jgi:UDP-glucose dehydrogenase|uniref:hypothetical protein n=1 Tax=Aggregatibacter segnis TaxID=739 RepID=UPI003FA07995